MSSPGARRKRLLRAVCIALLALLIWAALPNDPFYPGGHPIRKHFVFARVSDYMAPFVPTLQEMLAF